MKNLLLFGLILLSACAGSSSRPTANESLTGSWALTHLEGKELSTMDLPGRTPFLEFGEGGLSVGGHTGCNSLSGSYRSEGASQIRFGELITTKKACPGSLETEFLQMLSEVDQYEFQGGRLLLFDKGRQRARFFRIPED